MSSLKNAHIVFLRLRIQRNSHNVKQPKKAPYLDITRILSEVITNTKQPSLFLGASLTTSTRRRHRLEHIIQNKTAVCHLFTHQQLPVILNRQTKFCFHK